MYDTLLTVLTLGEVDDDAEHAKFTPRDLDQLIRMIAAEIRDCPDWRGDLGAVLDALDCVAPNASEAVSLECDAPNARSMA